MATLADLAQIPWLASLAVATIEMPECTAGEYQDALAELERLAQLADDNRRTDSRLGTLSEHIYADARRMRVEHRDRIMEPFIAECAKNTRTVAQLSGSK